MAQVESKIRELLGKANEVDASDALVEEAQALEEKAGLPNSKDVGDKTAPTQGSSNANPEMEDLSGSDDKGGLTSPVGKAASAKASKDNTLPKGQGAGNAPNFDTKEDPTSVVNQASSQGVREEAEDEDQEVIAEDEVEDGEEETLFEADIASLFADEEHLSEEFKTKAAGIFEAVVTARVTSEMEAIEAELKEEAEAAQASFQEDMVDKIDSYLAYVAENWMRENELAVEKGLRTEITEDFIKGMKTLFEEHYIEVPADKYDVLGEMQSQIDELKTKLDESIVDKLELVSEKTDLLRNKVLSESSTDLTITEAEKLAKLVESVEFDSEEVFAEKVAVIKENYFPKVKATDDDKMQDTLDESFITENSTMNIYTQAISKAVKK
jgi:hypothetical protein